MKIFFLIFAAFPTFMLFAQAENTLPDSIPKEIVNIVQEFPFKIKEIPIIALPKELDLNSKTGKAIISVWFDTNGIYHWRTLHLLTLKSDNETILVYRSKIEDNNFENPKSTKVEDFPLPIQPYVKFFKEKLNELEFIENKDIPKKIFYYYIPFTIKNEN